MSDELIARLRDMADDVNRHKYDVGDYWNAVEEAADELSDLRARLEALAAKWDVEASDETRTHGAGAYAICADDLRALLAPVAAPVPPKCEECVSCSLSTFGNSFDACLHSNSKFLNCDNERGTANNDSCGPTGRLFKRRRT